jgi:hypothetical protein
MVKDHTQVELVNVTAKNISYFQQINDLIISECNFNTSLNISGNSWTTDKVYLTSSNINTLNVNGDFLTFQLKNSIVGYISASSVTAYSFSVTGNTINNCYLYMI